jgi:hypothetical protein
VSGAIIILVLGLIFTLIALAMTLWNFGYYQRSDARWKPEAGAAAMVSVCVPARNEATNIEACVGSILANDWPNIEVLVYDDQSTDATPEILARLMKMDPRVRAVESRPLPEGWNGKQHACWRMSQSARGEWMIFTDADVRFAPDCLRRAVGSATVLKAGLVSAFPRQITGTVSEALAIPMIFFILLSYLPFAKMRGTTDASASAGCGQFLCIRRDAYDASGGHDGFKDSMHDGIKLPRAVRRAGFTTDVFDGTDVLACRMYVGLRQTWRGFAKNAYEGLGSLGLLIFITVVHLLAHVTPWVLLVLTAAARVTGPGPLSRLDVLTSPLALGLAIVCVLLQITHRLVLARRHAQPLWIALAHPIGIVMMTLIQWHSLYLHLTGKRAWRGRTLGAPGDGGVGGVTRA